MSSAPTTVRLAPARPPLHRPPLRPDDLALPPQVSGPSTRSTVPSPGTEPGIIESDHCPLRTDPLAPVARARAARPGIGLAVDPDHASAMVAIAAVEVLDGDRQQAQLARWLLPDVYDTLSRRAALTAPRPVPGRARHPCPGTATGTGTGADQSDAVGGVISTSGRRPVVRRLRMCRIDADTVESSVVVAHAQRIRAVAVRLVRLHGRWRASALEIG